MKIFKYKIIKYFPFTASEEFINIGFWLWDEKGNKVQNYITDNDEHIKILAKCPLIDAEFIKNSIERLKLETDERYWYGNHFRFGDFDAIAHDNLDSARVFLYHEKIGEKFKNISIKYKNIRYETIKNNAISLIQNDFKNDLEIISERGEYNLHIINKHSKKEIFSRLGNIAIDNDIKEAFFKTIEYDIPLFFLQCEEFIPSKKTQKSKESLEKVNLNFRSFYDEQTQNNTLKEIVSTTKQ
ncbi:DUF3037 domain-containing protein [Campylobacter lari]|uniref:DUF3037 domain-containing protein n=1 Tax=Campylobacter lari TaxID=201 RepID=UPI0013FFE274|nr:DUF3037 domain-containing protein [Campylobacter lari]EAI3912725.1 DUF3037 domain-containing protein [Campylobacter lari]EAI4812190.1 DUF3037 domain-containing protein [Campylobacter lari]EAI4841276.1 DUF3037 domain-containing protein [Campylobacter lari]EAI9743557.1 DUF3037 domain-containing protein [Campylobacter lari]EAK0953943.1 DUF3037 domain-containing protein [Campylobacter lari]